MRTNNTIRESFPIASIAEGDIGVDVTVVTRMRMIHGMTNWAPTSNNILTMVMINVPVYFLVKEVMNSGVFKLFTLSINRR
jgi:hypothetical protein